VALPKKAHPGLQVCPEDSRDARTTSGEQQRCDNRALATPQAARLPVEAQPHQLQREVGGLMPAGSP